jgi:hypothetical protein
VIQQWDDPKPGFKWPVAVAQRITTPADSVWEAISMPGNLEPCHPFCAENRCPGTSSVPIPGSPPTTPLLYEVVEYSGQIAG